MEEDERAVGGEALGGVAGERVAVVEVLGRVGGGDAPVDSGLAANEERVLLELDDGAARAVAEAERLVVSAAEDLVADPELALAEPDSIPAEPVLVEHEGVCRLVELVDVGAVVGEHQVPRGVAARFLPPVDEQPLLRAGRIFVDPKAAALGGVARYGSGSRSRRRPSASRSSGSRWRRLPASSSGRGGRRAPGRDRRRRPPAAGPRRRPEAASPGPFDRTQERSEDARFGHPRLVDDQNAAVRESAVAVGVEEQPVQGAAGDARGVLKLVGGAAARRRSQHGGVDAAEASANARSASVLPEPATPTTQTTRSGRQAASWTSIRCSPLSS